ncbi:hypothetical protein I552_0760 [Mycobacterium xenopi 3993]|nr:hypothetical protein I552_0760 [Mycobacterium xenopi 3993]
MLMVSPLYCQTLVPSGLVTNFGANSTYFAGSRPSKTSGGSTTWSSTLTRTRSLISIGCTFFSPLHCLCKDYKVSVKARRVPVARR